MDSLSREKEIFPKLIKEIRNNRNLTQREFAQLFSPHVTQQAIARWERGETFPARRYWQTLAELAGMELGQFYEYIGIGSVPTPSLLEDLILKIKSLTTSELEVISQVTADQWTSSGFSSELANKQHLALLKKGAKAWNKWRNKNPDIIPQLSGINLNEEDCKNLSGFNLDNANLADISGYVISFKGASLVQANLKGAKLTEVDLSHASLQEANLEEATLSDVNLSHADLTNAILIKASIKDAWLSKATFDRASLRGADIIDANFSQASLRKANLSEVNLRYSDLTEANLNEASLENATVVNCTIYGVSVWGTNTNGASFENLYISPDGRSGLPVDDLVLAPTIYWHRREQKTSQKFRQLCHLEEEAIKFAYILLNKYGEYSHTEGFRIYINVDEKTISKDWHQYQILQNQNSFSITHIPNYRDINLVLEGKAQSKILLSIVDGITESRIAPSDVENLKTLIELEEPNQSQRFAIVVPILEQILKERQTDNFSDEHYRIERIDEEIILSISSSHKIELMRARVEGGQWKMVNSSLSQNAVKYFQKFKSARKQSSNTQTPNIT
jgi:uncharacterized protein YjbI with pentapeptide repeats/DNA-binding XRE family transcriptional regulator